MIVLGTDAMEFVCRPSISSDPVVVPDLRGVEFDGGDFAGYKVRQNWDIWGLYSKAPNAKRRFLTPDFHNGGTVQHEVRNGRDISDPIL